MRAKKPFQCCFYMRSLNFKACAIHFRVGTDNCNVIHGLRTVSHRPETTEQKAIFTSRDFGYCINSNGFCAASNGMRLLALALGNKNTSKFTDLKNIRIKIVCATIVILSIHHTDRTANKKPRIGQVNFQIEFICKPDCCKTEYMYTNCTQWHCNRMSCTSRKKLPINRATFDRLRWQKAVAVFFIYQLLLCASSACWKSPDFYVHTNKD